MSDVEEIRLVPLFHVFPATFLSHVCVCVCVCLVISKQANFLLQSHTGSDVWPEKTNWVKRPWGRRSPGEAFISSSLQNSSISLIASVTRD